MKTLQKFKARIARATEVQLVALVSNPSLFFAWVRSDAEVRTLRTHAVKKLTAIRIASKEAADNSVQARLNRATALIRMDRAVSKTVLALVAKAKDGEVVTTEEIVAVERTLRKLTEGQLKAIFFAFVNAGHFDQALAFATEQGEAFALSVSSTIRFVEKQIFGGLMIALGVVASKGITKFRGIVAKAFAKATLAA